jgi:hypothetical protein
MKSQINLNIRVQSSLLTGLLLIIFMSVIFLAGCEEKTPYGLKSSEDHFLHSYFIANSKLFVKSRQDFDKQFESKEYKDLVKEVDKIYEDSGRYLQSEPIYLPIIQKISDGNKYVFVFETKEDTWEGILVKRLAFECDDLGEKLVFPSDCIGYYMIDAWEWPPAIYNINKGEIILKHKSLITGYLAGKLDLIFFDDFFSNKETHIAGSFVIYNKNKRLFLSVPARH